MKKFKFTFLAVLILALGVFTSCDKNDDEDEIFLDPELLGYWVDTFDEEEGKIELDILFFDENGIGSNEIKIITEETEEKHTVYFTYTTKGNKLTIDLSVEEIEITYQIEGNKLILDDDEYIKSE